MAAALHAAILAGAAAACGHQELYARGTVESVSCTSGARQPLADAAVSVECPGMASPIFQATTDARGQFSGTPPRTVPMTCAVEVAKAGYATRRYAVKDLCANQFIGTAPGSADEPPSCAIFGLTARLAQAGSP